MASDPQSPESAPTAASVGRAAAKAARRQALLAAAARLMAVGGYAAVRLEDIGAAVGVSGPAMYRHFTGKQDLLAAMLIDISDRLLAGATAVDVADPVLRLHRLVELHVDFATTEPDLITVQYRDLGALDDERAAEIRRRQRSYIGLWADALMAAVAIDRPHAMVRAQAVFGLINSAPRLGVIPVAELRLQLQSMAVAALTSSRF
ncbi:TetR/AcrR family transcriptional regulator [Williamsia sp. CHRR-6]|uniref:TetR/AcrR family transcriptional regulator n=1 Tax=Williamsia sp. CHRR-6 TaxID=2835871 RepID=UPI0027DC5CC0|nr:TetR/AcrR family transcriptional regulator [Williamsia sp. CHRR-6]